MASIARSRPVQNAARRELAANNCAFIEQVFLERITERDTSAVKLFIAAGMNPNARDRDGVPPLMRAAFNDQVEIIRLLLDRGRAGECDGQKQLDCS